MRIVTVCIRDADEPLRDEIKLETVELYDAAPDVHRPRPRDMQSIYAGDLPQRPRSGVLPEARRAAERHRLRAGGAAREKKARRKNIARKAREEEEIRLFRGPVSAVCTCMELDTENLLTALQTEFAKLEAVSVDLGTDTEHAAPTNSTKMSAKSVSYQVVHCHALCFLFSSCTVTS